MVTGNPFKCHEEVLSLQIMKQNFLNIFLETFLKYVSPIIQYCKFLFISRVKALTVIRSDDGTIIVNYY